MPSPGAFAEDVLDLVDQVPSGSAVAYGDVARLLGRGGPRQVGQVMSAYGDQAPWWRVVRADGTLPQPLVARAREHWAREETPVVERAGGGIRVDLSRARWDGHGARVPGDPGAT